MLGREVLGDELLQAFHARSFRSDRFHGLVAVRHSHGGGLGYQLAFGLEMLVKAAAG
jgi:hypothetical protein